MKNSTRLFEKAQKMIPGGVNSPVRAFSGVGGTPVFFERGEGAYLIDADQNRYIDYVGSWGPLILGHAHPGVVSAVQEAVSQGLSFGASTSREIAIAQKITELIPSIEKVRMVNSGTEAVMSAIRLARGFTGRDKIIKFVGCYHGHTDALLVKAGSGATTLSVPNSAGVPVGVTQDTLLADYNSLEQAARLFETYPDSIAAIIVEPIAGNMGCVMPTPDFLPGLRDLCTQHGSVLIFDEVITGFRVALGGAQAKFNVKADLTTLGKIIGGGMPVGAFGGRANIMDCIAPQGEVYQAGTLSGNPVAMAAGLKTLELISEHGFFEKLDTKTNTFINTIKDLAKQYKVPLQASHAGSLFGLSFTEKEHIRSFNDVMACNEERFKRFFHALLKAGVYIAPSAYESGFLSNAHEKAEIDKTLSAIEQTFKTL